MFENLQVMQMAQSMARHAAQRQTVVSQNMANADTPGYKARDVDAFSDTYAEGVDTPMRATRAGHIGQGGQVESAVSVRQVPGDASPDGNTVSLETEMVKAVEVKRQHDQSLAIYKSALNVLRTAVSRG